MPKLSAFGDQPEVPAYGYAYELVRSHRSGIFGSLFQTPVEIVSKQGSKASVTNWPHVSGLIAPVVHRVAEFERSTTGNSLVETSIAGLCEWTPVLTQGAPSTFPLIAELEDEKGLTLCRALVTCWAPREPLLSEIVDLTSITYKVANKGAGLGLFTADGRLLMSTHDAWRDSDCQRGVFVQFESHEPSSDEHVTHVLLLTTVWLITIAGMALRGQ